MSGSWRSGEGGDLSTRRGVWAGRPTHLPVVGSEACRKWAQLSAAMPSAHVERSLTTRQPTLPTHGSETCHSRASRRAAPCRGQKGECHGTSRGCRRDASDAARVCDCRQDQERIKTAEEAESEYSTCELSFCRAIGFDRVRQRAVKREPSGWAPHTGPWRRGLVCQGEAYYRQGFMLGVQAFYAERRDRAIAAAHALPLPYTSKHRFSNASTMSSLTFGRNAWDAMRCSGETKQKERSIERRVGPAVSGADDGDGEGEDEGDAGDTPGGGDWGGVGEALGCGDEADAGVKDPGGRMCR